MSMRVNTIVTHLRPEDAYTLIELPDQVCDVLMQSYGDDMKTMLNTDGVMSIFIALCYVYRPDPCIST